MHARSPYATQHHSVSIRSLFSTLFPHDNKRCVAPPGSLQPGVGKNIIVCSLMRSGTHALIDLLLNNFQPYRRTPLYVDFDGLIKLNLDKDEILGINGYLIKTHFPQNPLPREHIEILDLLAQGSHVIRPYRDLNHVRNSLQNFSHADYQGDLVGIALEADRFWGKYNPLVIPFDDLINSNKAASVIKTLSHHLQMPCNKKTIANPERHQVLFALSCKLATRILGKHSPRINTTIQFAATKPRGGSSAPSHS